MEAEVYGAEEDGADAGEDEEGHALALVWPPFVLSCGLGVVLDCLRGRWEDGWDEWSM